MMRRSGGLLVPSLMVGVMALAACSRMPPDSDVSMQQGAGANRTETGTGFDDSVSAAEAPEEASVGAGVTGTGDVGEVGGSSTTTGGAGSGQAKDADSQAASPGRGATPGGASSDRPGLGVAGRTVKVVFHEQQSDCPQNPPTAGNPGADHYKKQANYINEYVKFFNSDVLGPAGWKIQHQIVDDGGAYCPERQKAAAFKIAKEIKPFAALGFSHSAQGPVVADTITRAGILHIGTSWQTYAVERARHPYAWNVYPVAEKSLVNLVDWIDRRLKGTKFDRASPPAERVYGVVGLDNAEGRQLAQLTKSELNARGIAVKGLYLISPDAGVVAQQGSSTVIKMGQDGINSLVFGLSYSAFASTVALSTQMESQNFTPDVLIGTYGLAFFDQLHSKRVWANAKGVSPSCVVCLRVEVGADGQIPKKYAEFAENDNAYIEVWQKRLGHNGPPEGQASGVFVQLGALATGILHAGDVLNPATFAQSLDSAARIDRPHRCTTARFVGRDYKHVPGFEWDVDHDGGSDDFTTVYWVNKQTTFNTNGYYESYDNYVFVSNMKELPRQPSHDTGQQPADLQPQKPHIGIEAWTPCSKFPNYPRS